MRHRARLCSTRAPGSGLNDVCVPMARPRSRVATHAVASCVCAPLVMQRPHEALGAGMLGLAENGHVELISVRALVGSPSLMDRRALNTRPR